ncbi:MAG: polyprenyl synthetase family protein [Bacteroidales bacterium]
MTDIFTLQKLVEDAIQEMHFDRQPDNLYKPVSYSLAAGGKRLRPVLVLMAYELFHSDIDKALKPAIGIEVFHNFTLLHDDIMDKSDTRRGKPSVQAKWNPNVALLSGDAMSIIASDLINEAPRNQNKVTKAFTRAALDVCEGQQYDMDFELQKGVAEDDYLNMIKLKTASLIAVSLKIGGLMANAPDKDVENLYNLGISLGMGFQLQDDWLDCYGDQRKFGKPIGKDIINGKKTYLWILADKLAGKKEKTALNSVMENDKISKKEKIHAVISLYDQINVPTLTLQKINTYFDEAANLIDKLDVATERKYELIEFLSQLNSRDF